jgi:hypothetical protein
VRNRSYDEQPSPRKTTRDDRSTPARLAARVIDCGHDGVHDGELEPPRMNASPAAAPESERTTR